MKKLEKVLVIAYRFPPLDETSANRSLAVAKYFQEFGYYPIIVTRNWNRPITNTNDQFFPSGDKITFEKKEGYEVYTLPFKKIMKYSVKNPLIKKVIGLIDNILLYFNCFVLNEYQIFIDTIDEIIKNDPSIKKAMVIADPHQLFYVGYRLKKKYNIDWIADYRDEWNTLQVTYTHGFKKSFLHRLVFKIHKEVEKRWVSTAQYVTSVSPACTQRISEFVGVKGQVVYNGFFKENYIVEHYNKIQRDNHIEIIHNGTLYPTQQVEIFLEGVKLFVDRHPHYTISTQFVGIKYKQGAAERIMNAMKGYEHCVECTDRIPQKELFKKVKEADIVLHVSHGRQYTGLTSSKIFDHLGLMQPVICCPGDGDVVEEILTKSGLGIITDTPEDVYQALLGFITNEKRFDIHLDQEYIDTFQRKQQTKIFTELFNTF